MKQHRSTLGIIFLIVFIDLVGFGIVIPILPLYGERYSSSGLTLGLLMASYSAMQFIFAPILGRISDRVGRKPVLLISLAGAAAGYLIFGLADSIVLLFASRMVAGIAGANIATAQAVIADITGPENRARGMGIMGAAFGLGFILGPALGALLVGVAPFMPGVAAAATSTVAFVLTLTKLPETLAPSARVEARRHPLNLSSLRRALAAHPLVAWCFAAILLVIFAFSTFETTFAQLATARFGVDITRVGWLFVFAGLVGAVVQGGLVGRLARRFGEARLLVVGTVIAALGVGAVPAAPGLGPLMAALAVLALGHGLVAPSLSSLTSKLVHPDEVGGVMGVYQSFSSLARIVGPLWAELAYHRLGHASPCLSASVVYLLAFGVAAVVLTRLGGVEPSTA
ncbi:MAG TPA: MFS transporter [Candidatus Sulfomarinibacteraceae bacterium]|nr:MFS transporter [Candidatus Sulfomarinibacteraceae bacterium]